MTVSFPLNALLALLLLLLVGDWLSPSTLHERLHQQRQGRKKLDGDLNLADRHVSGRGSRCTTWGGAVISLELGRGGFGVGNERDDGDSEGWEGLGEGKGGGQVGEEHSSEGGENGSGVL
jgi:hypothetical protein